MVVSVKERVIKVEQISQEYGGPEKFQKYKDIVLEPYNYVKSLPSKNIRRKVTEVLNHWLKLSDEDLDKITEIMNSLHNASLIIDDIEDGSDLRRGSPATHKVFGLAQAINSANYVYFQALYEIMEGFSKPEKKLEIMDLALRGLMDLHTGQGVEIFWRDENLKAENGSLVHIPTEEEYYNVIVKKTSRQFSIVADIGKSMSDSYIDCKKFTDLVGTHFQIRDDLLNLISGTYESGKGFCEDISEGKFSYPIILALASREKENGISEEKAIRLLEILRMQTQDRDLKKEALDIIIESGAIDFTKKKVKELKLRVGKEVLRLGGNPVFLEYESVFDDYF